MAPRRKRPVLVVGLAPEDPGAQAERRGPTQVVEHHAADVQRATGPAVADVAQDPLLVCRAGCAARGARGPPPCCRCRRRRAVVLAARSRSPRGDGRRRSCGAHVTHGAARCARGPSTHAPRSARRSASASIGPAAGVPGATAALVVITPRDRSARLRQAMLCCGRADRAVVSRSRKASSTPRAAVHALGVARAAHLPGPRPLPRQHVGRAGDHPDRQAAAQPVAVPVLGERTPEPARARAEQMSKISMALPT